ncbi:MAG: circadian clock KaiB family protein [Proteobacteria bacterium]|nr:circadian clock KaiB family protein [Pseudomonadota bacterium]
MKYELRLWVAGQSMFSRQAIETIKDICKNELKGKYKLEIIDVHENPDLAEENKIFATPTLIKELPAPLSKIIGNLKNKEKVLLGLEIQPAEDAK